MKMFDKFGSKKLLFYIFCLTPPLPCSKKHSRTAETGQLLCRSDMTDTEHNTTSGSNEEEDCSLLGFSLRYPTK